MSNFNPDKTFRMKYGYGFKTEDITDMSDSELDNTDYTHLCLWYDRMWGNYQAAEDKMKADNWDIIALDADGVNVLHVSNEKNRVQKAKETVLQQSGQSEADLLENERVARCMIGSNILENDLKASDFATGSPHRALFGEMRELYENAAKGVIKVLEPIKNDGGARTKSYNYWAGLPDWLDKAWKGELKN